MTWLLACTPKTLDVGGDDSSLLDSSDSAEILWDGCDRDDDSFSSRRHGLAQVGWADCTRPPTRRSS